VTDSASTGRAHPDGEFALFASSGARRARETGAVARGRHVALEQCETAVYRGLTLRDGRSRQVATLQGCGGGDDADVSDT
jgi:hypothetical protein